MSLSEMMQRAMWSGYATNSVQVADVLVCLVTVLVLSLYIYFVYRSVTKNAFYNKNFNLSLIVMAIVVAAIILTIQTNIVISLGMVGALSIVRYRTAIKDPMDLVFLFWSISIGIICGAGFGMIAIIASLIVSVVLVIFSRMAEPRGALILLVNCTDAADEEKIMHVINESCQYCSVKSRNLTKNHMDMAIEVGVVTDLQSKLVQDLIAIESVTGASLVAHDGEITG